MRATKSFWIQSFNTTTLQITGMLIGLILSATTARWLGAAEKGYVDALVNLVALLGQIFGVSLNYSIMKSIRTDASEKHISHLVKYQFQLSGILTLALFFCLLAIKIAGIDQISGISLKTLIICGLPLVTLGITLQNLSTIATSLSFSGTTQLAQGCGKLIALIATFIALYFTKDYQYALAFLATSQLVAIIIIYRKIKPKNFEREENYRTALKTLLITGLKAHPNTIAIILGATINPALLSHFHKTTDVAYFTVAYQLYVAQTIIPQAVAAVATNSILTQELKQSWKIQRINILKLIIISISITVISHELAPYLIRFLFGAQFTPAVKLFRSLLPLLTLTSVMVLVQPYWAKLDLLRYQLFCGVGASMATTISSLLLVPSQGAQGAVLAVAISTVFTLIINLPLIFKLEQELKIV